MDSVKTCAKCATEKPVSEFYTRKDRYATKPRSICKVCTNRQNCEISKRNITKRRRKQYLWSLRKLYGITEEMYESKVKDQDFRCRICGEIAPLHVDHDHKTGKARDLLCHHCNVGLGNFRDDPNMLKAALFYLERHAS